MNKITGRCDICNAEIKPADSQSQFERNLGQHKLHAHNIRGLSSTPEGRKKIALMRYWMKQGLSREEAERKADATALAKGYTAPAMDGSFPNRRATAKSGSSAKHLEVDMCPLCRAEFLIRKDKKLSPVKLDYCPDCGIHFYYAK